MPCSTGTACLSRSGDSRLRGGGLSAAKTYFNTLQVGDVVQVVP